MGKGVAVPSQDRRFDIGYATGKAEDPARPDWDGTGPRPLAWTAWYPAPPDAVAVRTPPRGLFRSGPILPGAPLAAGGPWPLVLLSHGTGGSADGLGWLARGLARRGAIVLGVNHHGNTGTEPYRAEGFLAWWERAADLSVLLDWAMLDSPFAGALDAAHIGAAGFSLGAYSVLSVAGAVTDMALFQDWRRAHGVSGGPREFPDLDTRLAGLLAQPGPFRASWERQSDSYRDPRVSRVAAIAPPPPVRAFAPHSLAAIPCPVTLIHGGADAEAPSDAGADWLAACNPAFRSVCVGADVGHYTFLDVPAGAVPAEARILFQDPDRVDRAAVHDDTVRHVRQGLEIATG